MPYYVVNAVLCIVGALFYDVFAQGVIQPWARDGSQESQDEEDANSKDQKDHVTFL